MTAKDANFATPFKDTVIVAVVGAETLACGTVNVTDDFPAGTITLEGGDAAVEFEDDTVTAIPPEGAGPERVIVPTTFVEELPLTDVGLTEKEDRAGARIDRLAC